MSGLPPNQQPPYAISGGLQGDPGGSSTHLPPSQRGDIAEAHGSKRGRRCGTMDRLAVADAGNPAGGPGKLGLLATPTLKLVFAHLKAEEQLRFRVVSRHFESALSTLVTSLKLTIMTNDRVKFVAKPFLMLTCVEELELKICNDKTSADETLADELEQLLNYFMGRPALHYLKVYSPNQALLGPMVLEHLGKCTGLTELYLDFERYDGELSATETVALATAVSCCHFPWLKALTLGGWLLFPIQEHAPFGLLTIWVGQPETFTTLERLCLSVDNNGSVLLDGALRNRLAALTGKRLRHFELTRKNYCNANECAAFARGVCSNAPLLESLKLDVWFRLETAQLETMLRAAAPNEASPLKQLCIGSRNFTPLTQAMRGGRLQQLEILDVIDGPQFTREDEPALQTLLECLRGDPRTCPRLRALFISTCRDRVGDLLAGLWAAMGGRQLEEVGVTSGHKVKGDILERCTGRRTDWPRLQKLNMRGVIMSAASAAAIVKALLRNCPVRNQVSFAAAIDSFTTDGMWSDVYDCLDMQCSKEGFMEDPARAVGLRELCLYVDSKYEHVRN